MIAKEGRHSYLGYGIVTSDYSYDTTQSNYHHRRKVDWLKNGSWPEDDKSIVLKTLTDITKYPDYVNRLKELIGMNVQITSYTIDDAMSNLFMERDDFEEYLRLLKMKKILYCKDLLA